MSTVLAWIRRRESTPRALMYKRLILIVPTFMSLGAGMELFMIKTGFYSVATRKEAERRLEAENVEYARYRRERKEKEQTHQQQQQQQQQQQGQQQTK